MQDIPLKTLIKLILRKLKQQMRLYFLHGRTQMRLTLGENPEMSQMKNYAMNGKWDKGVMNYLLPI